MNESRHNGKFLQQRLCLGMCTHAHTRIHADTLTNMHTHTGMSITFVRIFVSIIRAHIATYACLCGCASVCVAVRTNVMHQTHAVFEINCCPGNKGEKMGGGVNLAKHDWHTRTLAPAYYTLPGKRGGRFHLTHWWNLYCSVRNGSHTAVTIGLE